MILARLLIWVSSVFILWQFWKIRYLQFSIIGQLLSSQHRLVYLSSVWLFTSQHRINSTFSLNLYCAFFTQSEGNSSFPEKYMIVWKPIKLWMRYTNISKIIFPLYFYTRKERNKIKFFIYIHWVRLAKENNCMIW